MLEPLPGAAGTSPSQLRDITVIPAESSATATFLVTRAVRTVVVEPKKNGVAQVRMKSMAAEKQALNSALLREGVLKIAAHIERTDVLVADFTFAREVTDMRVIRRNDTAVVVLIELGKELPGAGTAKEVAGNQPQRNEKPSRKRSVTSGRGNKGWALSTIVIDPGHGGSDPGTIGIDSLLEKEITLAVAKRLRDAIREEMPGVNVVLTRESDEYVTLEERSDIANRSGGRLFLSIHCNAMPEKPHPRRGFECYILRPGRSEDAARIAAAEHDLIRNEAQRQNYDRWEAEMVILSGLAQNAFARYSEEAAQSIRRPLGKQSGIPDRGVHQAGFYVLVGTAMPAVLIELGYLTNERDARALSSSSVQRNIARGIARGIRNYEKVYRSTLQ